MTDLQKRTCHAVVNVFEGGSPRGNYAAVQTTDSGIVSYGRCQATLASGSLGEMLSEYVKGKGNHASQFAFYKRLIDAKDPMLRTNKQFLELLRSAAKDSVMQRVQNSYFDKAYWRPAVKTATDRNVTTPLGIAVVFDSFVHGSFYLIASTVTYIDEKTYVAKYCEARRQWLASKRGLLAKTVYRPQTFLDLIAEDNWSLDLPFTVRGVKLTEANV